MSTMERIRDQCMRRRENSPNGIKWQEEKEVLYDYKGRSRIKEIQYWSK